MRQTAWLSGTVAQTAPAPAATDVTPASFASAGKEMLRRVPEPIVGSRTTVGVAQSPTQTASPCTTRLAG